MSVLRNIVTSNTEPSVYDLWVNDGNLHYFGPNGWEVIGTSHVVSNLDGAVIINDLKRNKVGDMWALATGESTYAHGYASATFNENTVAYNDAESAFGTWNVSHDGEDERLQTLFSVGMGTGEKHANAFELMRNGDMYLFNIGGYNGTNAGGLGISTLQELVKAGGGSTPTPLDTFDASDLYAAYTNHTPITEDFKDALVDAVKRNALVYITNSTDRFSFKVVVVFAGQTKDTIELTASDHVAHYKIVINLKTNMATLEVVDIVKKYIFRIDNTAETMQSNMELVEKIGLDAVVTVKIEGTQGKNQYDTLGVYNKGTITALENGHQILFDINFDNGFIKVMSDIDVTRVEECVTLEVGDSDEIKTRNLEMLPQGTFQACLEYGYGVGTFQASTGGFVHTTTAKGNEVFYDIKSDGSITKNDEYVKPNEPYTLTINQSLIGTALDDVTSSALKKAGEIVVITSSGPITYTRTTDSTKTMIYFTDEDMNGETIRLSYNNSNKMLSAVKVPARAASTTMAGVVKQVEAIPDITPGLDAFEAFNNLLKGLRKAGILAQ